MAEGHRKLALMIYLLRYGVLEIGSTPCFGGRA